VSILGLESIRLTNVIDCANQKIVPLNWLLICDIIGLIN